MDFNRRSVTVYIVYNALLKSIPVSQRANLFLRSFGSLWQKHHTEDRVFSRRKFNFKSD